MEILDFGAGGGHDFVPLAYMGYEVDALDCSDTVLKNLVVYKESVEKYARKKLKIDTIVADILDANLPSNRYDVIFSCGVTEHFLDEKERREVYKILSKSLRKGGYVITFVPNGNHPARSRQRKERLGGYNIEEIDYTPSVFEKDIGETGLVLEKVKGFDLFGYVFILPALQNRFLCSVVKPLYLLFRVIENLFPCAFTRMWFWLFFVARRL